jgi:hypothetical protein
MARPHRSDVAADRTHERRSPSAPLRWIAAAGALLGAMLYSNWLLEMAFTRSLPDPDLFISELAATDQPHGEWFRGATWPRSSSSSQRPPPSSASAATGGAERDGGRSPSSR